MSVDTCTADIMKLGLIDCIIHFSSFPDSQTSIKSALRNGGSDKFKNATYLYSLLLIGFAPGGRPQLRSRMIACMGSILREERLLNPILSDYPMDISIPYHDPTKWIPPLPQYKGCSSSSKNTDHVPNLGTRWP